MNFTRNCTHFQGFSFKLLGHFWVCCSAPTEKVEILKFSRILFRRMCPSGSYWDADKPPSNRSSGKCSTAISNAKNNVKFYWFGELVIQWLKAWKERALHGSHRFFSSFAWIIEDWLKFRGLEWGGCQVWAGKGEVREQTCAVSINASSKQCKEWKGLD